MCWMYFPFKQEPPKPLTWSEAFIQGYGSSPAGQPSKSNPYDPTDQKHKDFEAGAHQAWLDLMSLNL